MAQYIKIDDRGNKFWFKDKKMSMVALHREDGPAVEWADGHKVWLLNGERHREDGPAIEYTDGDKEWFLNGKQLSEEEFNARMSPTKELTVAEIEKLLGHRVKVVK